MELSIIIVNWNSVDYLARCLASLSVNASSIEHEVIVIDSASYDGCDRLITECFPGTHFIQSSENIGFARANNKALAMARGEFVLFLNPDTEIRPHALDQLLVCARNHPDAGCIGGRLINPDGSTQTSCTQSVPTIVNQLLDSDYLRARWPRSSLWGMAPLFAPSSEPVEAQAISGACIVMRRDVCQKLGGFSEDYFMYAEDIDLSYKARASGYRNYFVPNAEVVHYGGSSTQKTASDFSTVMMREAVWRFLRKTRGNAYATAYRIMSFLAALFRLVLLAIASASRLLINKEPRPDAAQKWRAILRWSLHQHPAIKKYYVS